MRIPNLYRESASGTMPITFADEMLKHRELGIVDAFDQSDAYAFCQLLRWLCREAEDEPITIYVDSPGGDVGAALAIIDVMNDLPCQIRTICLDHASAAAALIFVMGDERLMYAHAYLLIDIPAPLSAPGGFVIASERAEETDSAHSQCAALFRERSKVDEKTIEAFFEKDVSIDAAKAVELGFADGIVGAVGA